MYDPTGSDSGHEWVEVYNQSDEPVTLDDQWKFFDGSSHILNLAQGTATLAPHTLAVIADKSDIFLAQYPLYDGTLFDSVVSIGNSGSTIALYTNGQATADSSLTFDPSWGGSGNNKTLEKIDLTSGNDRSNWRESSIDLGTPGSFPDPNPDPDPVIPPIDLRDKLIITELLPNPVGSDTDGEWIELYNLSEQELSLGGVTVHDTSSSLYTFPVSTVMSPHTYLVLGRTVSNIALNNDADAVILKDGQGREVDRTDYNDSAAEGVSYALVDDHWQWSSQPTPGADNTVPKNQPPVINYSISSAPYIVGSSISFDVSASRDPEGGTLTYAWDFTDGTTSNRKTTSHSFKSSGIFNVSLRVSDASGLVSEQIISIEVKDKNSTTDSSSKKSSAPIVNKQATTTEEVIVPVVDTVRISEFMPNPTGSDASEWIELYNTGETEVDISQWQLDDEEGGSKPFRYPPKTVIGAKHYQIWSKSATKLALNNSSDSVRLLDPDNNVLDSIDYAGGKEGQSYEKDFDSEEWQWQSNPTMGLAAVAVLGISNEPIEIATSSSEELKVVSNQVEGIVVVSPGSWYKQKFYLQALDAPDDQVIEVYNSRGDFPELQSGDQIIIQDPVESTSGELRRLKISTPEQIVIAAHNQTLPNAAESLGDITDEDLNHTVSVSAKVNTIATQSLQLVDDDNNTLSVYLGPDWSWTDAKPVKGSAVTITGVIQKSSGKLRLRALTAAPDTRALVATSTQDFNTTTIHTADKSNTKKTDVSHLGWYALAGLLVASLGYGGYRWWFIGK
jgi:hypothetical protein